MGRKKRKQLLPWCWYCDREFEDDKTLINHQKAKHFKCNICQKRLNSASGMQVHMDNVHKESVDRVPNAIEGRDTFEFEIFGMDGVPEEDKLKREEQILGGTSGADKRIRGDDSTVVSPIGGMFPPPPHGMPPGMAGFPPPPHPGAMGFPGMMPPPPMGMMPPPMHPTPHPQGSYGMPYPPPPPMPSTTDEYQGSMPPMPPPPTATGPAGEALVAPPFIPPPMPPHLINVPLPPLPPHLAMSQPTGGSTIPSPTFGVPPPQPLTQASSISESVDLIAAAIQPPPPPPPAVSALSSAPSSFATSFQPMPMQTAPLPSKLFIAPEDAFLPSYATKADFEKQQIVDEAKQRQEAAEKQKQQVLETRLVWTDEEYSIEERRAALDRYKYAISAR